MPRFQDQVAIQNEGERQPRPVGQGGLDVEAAVDQAVADHGEAVAGAGADCLHEIVFIPRRARLRTHAEQGRDQSRLEKLSPMVVHLI